ncbi:MAG: ABC transporter ATP-binding protein [Rhodobacteraceae bacterium]|uniref:ABC transporter ATP-binding protein n=1 Tax=Tabrizicola sp. SY72 TaxID=2741673 RepID=UPI0015720B58|nr:ABC transporter ATP-binding protein [Tabrizicola sp. SY72]MBL9057847.1 ABC transporter ATP-binding protein [Paracoccaceae bacterium]NTT87284.1 ABC transporter ATP-binding protein [Tabrizicola sp. SY72]
MIKLENVWKTFYVQGNARVVARDISVTFPKGRSIGLLGRNGAGKSTLLRLISGAMDPDRGKITIDGTLSWPVGFSGSFHRDLTGAQNARFVARVYGVDTDELLAFVADFSELGKQFYQPVNTYSSGMKSRLAFGISMGIHFDMYLIDEVTAVGDAAFQAKSEAILQDRMKTSGSIFITHSLDSVRRICSGVGILEDGKLTYFDDVNEGLEFHKENMKRRSDEV